MKLKLALLHCLNVIGDGRRAIEEKAAMPALVAAGWLACIILGCESTEKSCTCLNETLKRQFQCKKEKNDILNRMSTP